MKKNFRDTLHQLRLLANRFDETSDAQKRILLGELKEHKLSASQPLEDYNHLLLFLCAHASDENLLHSAEEAKQQLGDFLQNLPAAQKEKFGNTGLPFTTTTSSYSHDMLRLLMNDETVHVSFNSFSESGAKPESVLQFTLPAVEKETTASGFSTAKLFSELVGKDNDKIRFLLSEFSRFDDQPFVKDQFFSSMGLYADIAPRDKSFSKTFNAVRPAQHYYHHDLIRHFDSDELLARKLPRPSKLDSATRAAYIHAIRNSLTLLQRETDPATYMDENSFRLYELERGISVAIFGIVAPRQLPLESYIGYTLFKNGYPAAYGGAWVFGHRALFGINVFESFRGGESGFVLCQLLRVYHQAFDLDYFEVEPYQYGLGNPEGIHSGAFWFYYRYGFRPLDEKLYELAESENKRIAAHKNYRSSADVLKQFTKSNIALQLDKKIPLRMNTVRERITRIIREAYKADRVAAENALRRKFIRKFGSPGKLSKDEENVFREMIFFAEALDLQTKQQGKLLNDLIRLKPSDVFAYQASLKKLISSCKSIA